MSDITDIAATATEHVDQMLVEMLQEDWPDNAILLGTVHCGNTPIQVQLKITRERKEFMDEQ